MLLSYYNPLPIGVQEMVLKSFLILLKDYIKKKAFYSIEEFIKDI